MTKLTKDTNRSNSTSTFKGSTTYTWSHVITAHKFLCQHFILTVRSALASLPEVNSAGDQHMISQAAWSSRMHPTFLQNLIPTAAASGCFQTWLA